MSAIALKLRAGLGGLARSLPLARRVLGVLALIAACVALALGGLWLGLRLSTPATYPSALGSASFQLQPSAHGQVEVFIPLADWGLRAHAFKAPLKLHVEPRVLNRQALLAAAQGDRRLLDRTVKDLSRDGQKAIARGVRYLALGVVLSALAGLVLLLAYRVTSRRLLIALPAGTILAGVLLGGGMLWRLQDTWNVRTLERPTYFARGAELIQLLNAAQHANQARDSYASKLQGALSGFASLLADPNMGALDRSARRALLISDLHNNTVVLASLTFYAQGQPVFFVGDFGNTGNASETKSLVPGIARLGSRVTVVSGDHDSRSMMQALARRGAVVLTSHGQLRADGRYGSAEVSVGGLRVAGFEDPLQYSGPNPDDPRRVFSFGELPDPAAALGLARGRLYGWFQSLPQPPDVVLVHQNGLAQWLANTLYSNGYRRPLTILTGHDHIQHVNHYGPIDVVDAGTVGASGLYGVGADYVGLGELHFASRKPVLQAADLIQIEPVSGAAQAQRVVLPARCVVPRVDCGSGVDYLDPREGPNTGPVGGASPVSPLDPASRGGVP